MVPWWTLLIPTVLFVIFWALYRNAAHDRDFLFQSIQHVEMEYRLMTQNAALFDRVKELVEASTEGADAQN